MLPPMHDHLTLPERLFESDDLMVLNKPSGISLLEDRSSAENLWRTLQSTGKPFLVHRLDKGTSGVLLVAKSQAAQSGLARLFNAREVRKFYVAKVVGEIPMGHTLTISLPLKPGRKSRYRVAGQREHIERVGTEFRLRSPSEDGFDAVTRVRSIGSTGEHSWVLAQPLTGRSHQLRVHLAWIGHPIVGDHLYGKPHDPIQTAERLMLHCHRLVVPGSGTFKATIPFVDFLP
jgi:tRNA pseudouridine32 synthase / 23S rRNA pseudouridine746 synthase